MPVAPARRLANRFLTLALSLFVPCAGVSAESSPEPVSSTAAQIYDPIVEGSYSRFHLPGLAVGVIEDGKIVYVRTMGERAAGSGQKIDTDTLFKIGSNSKAMTTALLGRLVDQDKLRWDDPVTKYLPDFRMYDPSVTKQMRISDLLTHSSGLPGGAGDLMLWPEPNDFTRADIIHALRYFKPAYSFRSRYEYDNLLYVVAGEVAAVAGGAPYETLMRREIFDPLGLTRCQVGRWERDAVGNVAEPHDFVDGRNQVIRADGAIIPATASDPAGGIRCSLKDMLTWTLNWLAPTPAQLAWLSPAQRKILQAPHMLIPVPARMRKWNNTHVMAYGYGWRMADANGHWTVWHTGTLAGMFTELRLLPDSRSGFVTLINGNDGQARTVLSEVLLKHFTDPTDRRGVKEYAAELDAIRAAPGEKPAVPDENALQPADPRMLTGRLGVYGDPWLGLARLCTRDDQVRFQVAKSPRLAGTVMKQGDRYWVRWDDRSVQPDAWLDFQAGSPVRLTMVPHNGYSADFRDLNFTRKSKCEPGG
ncbi:penicillin-binding protein [Phyllobacterium salinisoli]|uniref:Penicillin-binding protein n=2 Tax=Phyllobacterium salinisoli TaxID=1899321 RepID=A0A368K100_9HYPH|nr:penicillin-binding protein [Phyllobacterium salinisoli]